MGLLIVLASPWALVILITCIICLISYSPKEEKERNEATIKVIQNNNNLSAWKKEQRIKQIRENEKSAMAGLIWGVIGSLLVVILAVWIVVDFCSRTFGEDSSSKSSHSYSYSYTPSSSSHSSSHSSSSTEKYHITMHSYDDEVDNYDSAEDYADDWGDDFDSWDDAYDYYNDNN